MGFGSRCYIVGAGDFFGKIEKNENDLVIAADGGLKHLEAVSVTPDIIIGDFDSLGFVPDGKNVIKLPVMKDVTDTYAAVNIAKEKGYKNVILLGCTGGKRSDHFIANLQTLIFAAENGINAYMVGDNEVFTAVVNSQISFKEKESGTVSVFSFDRKSVVSISGLLYETNEINLTNSATLGISNEFKGEKATVKVVEGTVIVYWQGGIDDILSPAFEV